MPANLKFDPSAEDDIADAYFWYERRSAGLGDRFMADLHDRIGGVLKSPLAHRVSIKSYRRANLRVFPYGFIYDYANGIVTVLVVFHTSTDPRKLLGRLP